MLLGQQFGGRHECSLQTAADSTRRGGGRHHCFAAAHVALHQPHHRLSGGEIPIDFRERSRLRAGERERQRFEEAALEPASSASGHAGSLRISWRSSRRESW